MPLYVRLDALIPTIEPGERAPNGPFTEVDFHGYLREKASFELLDVDGATRVSASRSVSRLDVEVTSVPRAVHFTLHALDGVPPPDLVTVNGEDWRPRDPTQSQQLGWSLLADGRVRVWAGQHWARGLSN